MNGWQSLKQDSRRTRLWLLVSVLLHLPFTPLGPLFGLLTFISRPEAAVPPAEQLRGIPVELLEEQQTSEAKTTVQESLPSEPLSLAPAQVAAPAPKPKPKHKPPDHDAGLPEEADAAVPFDAGHVEPVVAKQDPDSDAGSLIAAADAGAPTEGRSAEGATKNPEDALAASTHGLANSNANVRLSLFMDRVRAHPLGNQLGQLLKSVYQWRDFFTPAALDPVQDFDRIFLFGPQLRDSSQVAAFLQHSMRPARIRRAIDGLVKRSGAGSAWLKGSRNPAARAIADRAQRLFVVYPNHVVAVVPPGAEKDALSLPEFKLPQAKGDELARAFVKTPWRALLGTRFPLPQSIRSADIRAYAEQDGGARIEADLEDDSRESAERDAKQLKRDVDTVTLANNFILSGSRVAEPLQVRVDENHVHATLYVTRRQAERILRVAEAYLTPEGREDTRRAAPAHALDAGM
jgi:hypothetical protein